MKIVAVLGPTSLYETLGNIARYSLKLLMPSCSSFVLSNAVTLMGTSCKFSARFWAVTIISSSTKS